MDSIIVGISALMSLKDKYATTTGKKYYAAN